MLIDKGSRRQSTVFISWGFCLCFLLYSAVVIRFPNNFFADDSYFYFQVASNIANHSGSTFNRIVPTNGYHPLWMLICVGIFKLMSTKNAALYAIAWTIALLDLGTICLLSRVCSQMAGGLWWVPWFVYVPFAFLSQLGTEGSLSGCLIATLVYITVRITREPSFAHALCYTLAGSLAVLARLDNIFIVAVMFLFIVRFSAPPLRKRIRRQLLLVAPLYLLFWGAYISTNVVWFGTIQPISGILKSHHAAGSHVNMPPHVAIFTMVIIVASMISRLWFRPDSFLRTVEAPYALGVVIHAIYIGAVMGTGETRWTWYYTTWILLASLLLARNVSLLAAGRADERPGSHRPGMQDMLAYCALVSLLLAWFPLSYKKYAHFIPDSVAYGYEQNLSVRLHLNAVLAFDKPGRMAFFTDVRVVPLDGLMGDLRFQQELATRGIAAFDSEHNVAAFVGPPQPMDVAAKTSMCDSIYLGSTQFHCVQTAPDAWIVDRVEVFSRLQKTSAGSIYLDPKSLIWNQPGQVAVWSIAADRTRFPK